MNNMIEGKLTPLGNLIIEIDRDENRVKLTLEPREGTVVRHRVTDDGNVSLEMWEGTKAPSVHDEVTIGGVTVEVVSVSTDADGNVWVLGDNGQRLKWE